MFDAFPQNTDDSQSHAVENLHASLQRVLARRSPDAMALQRYDIRVPDGDGARFVERYWSPTNTPVFDGDGQLTHIIHRVVDVTAFVETAARATRLEAEIAAQAMEIQDANRRLQSVNGDLVLERDLREQFVLALSHDIRTPLSAATMGSHVISRKADDANEVRRVSARVLANLERIDRMLRDLLDASHVDAGGTIELARSPCDLVEVARAVLDDLGTVHGDRFRLVATASPVGEWDGDALRGVIENLCANGVHHGAPDRPVTVTLDERADEATVVVHNCGAPIPPDAQDTLFNAHVRRTGHPRAGGRGWRLGLPVVRGLVTAHGGTIELSSSANEGTTFTVRLPLRREVYGAAP